MRTLLFVLVSLLMCPHLSIAQEPAPFEPDSLTRGLWHMDETSGTSVLDQSGGGNSGSAVGTLIIPGRFGNARSLNGNGDYISVPSSPMFDFDTSSFRIDLWFKAPDQTAGHGQLLRRGLAPVPGYMIHMDRGQIVGQIGNRGDSHWPDTLITVRSDSSYGDNKWHLVTMIRDREHRRLLLYVDGQMAARPSDDPFMLPIVNDRPLTIGRWEYPSYPYFFNGVVDEVRLSSPRLVPGIVVLRVQPTELNFGNVRVGSKDTLLLRVSNAGVRDTLHIVSTGSTNSRFAVPSIPHGIGPGTSVDLPVYYTPLADVQDSGLVTIASDDSVVPVLHVPVKGKGVILAGEPMIDNVGVIPGTSYLVRMGWFRSVYDSAGTADPVTAYSVWRSVSGSLQSNPGLPVEGIGQSPSGLSVPSWEFITEVPAMQFEKYSSVVPGIVDYTSTGSPNTLMVAARTRGLQVYLSLPATVNLRPGSVTGTGGDQDLSRASEFMLAQNYPNPFNPTTVIRYTVPHRTEVRLSVYNIVGEEIALLHDGVRERGYYEVRLDASGFAAGVYLCRMEAGGVVLSKKLLLLR